MDKDSISESLEAIHKKQNQDLSVRYNLTNTAEDSFLENHLELMQ